MGEAVNGADLTPEMVWAGYSQGYFPMTVYANEVEWLYPRRRTLFPIADCSSEAERLRRRWLIC